MEQTKKVVTTTKNEKETFVKIKVVSNATSIMQCAGAKYCNESN